MAAGLRHTVLIAHRMLHVLRNMNGILAVEKPSGVSLSKIVLQLQSIFDSSDVFAHDLAEAKQKVHDQLSAGTNWLASKIANRVKRTKIKVGHGGTLDPLASGVVIVGVGSGTKKLSYYLGECTKTYEARAMVGQSTTTGDSEGEVLTRTETAHVTVDALKAAAAKFVGHIKQTPPIYLALKVDGKPLYEYAREGIPLPKAIKARDVVVHLFDVHDDYGPMAQFQPIKSATVDGESVEKMLFNNPTLNDHELFFADEYMARTDVLPEDKKTDIQPRMVDPATPAPEQLPVFHATATVSSGTYIRSLLSDVGRAVESLAFMVELVRTKQSDWELGKNVFQMSDFERDERVWGKVLQKVFAEGSLVDIAGAFKVAEEEAKAEPAKTTEPAETTAETEAAETTAETAEEASKAEEKASTETASTKADSGKSEHAEANGEANGDDEHDAKKRKVEV